jgi:hypothetical protein
MACLGTITTNLSRYAVVGLNILSSSFIFFQQSPAFAQQSSPFSWVESLGSVPSGTIKDMNDLWCVFNQWEQRDKMKSIYRGDNVNFDTQLGGKWFCVQKF